MNRITTTCEFICATSLHIYIFNKYYFTEDIHYLPQSGYYGLLPSSVMISEMWEGREHDVCVYVCGYIHIIFRAENVIVFYFLHICQFWVFVLISICCKKKLLL